MYTLNKDIKALNTFGLPCITTAFFSFTSEEDLITFIKSGKTKTTRVLVLGGGSNILFTKDFEGLIIHPATAGMSVEHLTTEHAIVKVSAGVIWDDFVEWSVNQGFGGIENLSFIPGLAGASPVQNIGAYGSEAKDTLLKVRCISLEDGSVIELTAADCRPGYRDSIFKRELRDKVVVTTIWYRLSRKPSLNTSYPDVASECTALGGITLQNVRQAIIKIRRRKLPDPSEIGNAGSFFKNPVISSARFSEFLKEHPDMPGYSLPDGTFKIAAGWLIDRCGWKGKRVGDAGVHPNQALVLVNYGNATGNEIISLAEGIKKSVKEMFSVDILPEVEII